MLLTSEQMSKNSKLKKLTFATADDNIIKMQTNQTLTIQLYDIYFCVFKIKWNMTAGICEQADLMRMKRFKQKSPT